MTPIGLYNHQVPAPVIVRDNYSWIPGAVHLEWGFGTVYAIPRHTTPDQTTISVHMDTGLASIVKCL